MTFQIDHNLLHDVDNYITQTQWDQIINEVINHTRNSRLPEDTLYLNKQREYKSTRQSIYDNYDRHYVPGLDFVTTDNSPSGRLTVYNGTEQARAPITFEQGIQIAQNFFNEYGNQMAEEIVCEWVMDGNPSIF
jgi:hypothetical protein